MAKLVKSYPLSSMTGGVNRIEPSKNQAAEGEDVVADAGLVRRRDAFHAFTHGYPHTLPAGQVYLKYYQYSGGGAFGDYSTRKIGSASKQSFGVGSSGSGLLRLFVGCDTQFQGINWAYYLPGINSDTVQHYIRIRFVTSDWVESTDPADDVSLYTTCPYVLDSTKMATGDLTAAASKPQPLLRDGFISWHKNSQPSSWDTKRDVDSVSAYWVIIDMSTTPIIPEEVDGTDYVGAWPSNSVNFQLKSPGLRCFTLHPVTGLYSFHNKLDPRLLIATTSGAPRGQETGGPQFGAWDEGKPVRRVGLLQDEGAGFVGTYDTSGWSGTGWTGDSIGAGTSLLQKNIQTYEWLKSTIETIDSTSVRTHRGSWGYPVLEATVSPLSSPSPTTTTFSFTMSRVRDTQFEDCIFVCMDNGAGSITGGRANRVKSCTVSGSTVAVTFAAAWNALPVTTSTFRIFGVPHYCQLGYKYFSGNLDASQGLGLSPAEYEISHTSDTSAHVIHISPGGPDGNFIGDRYDISDFGGNNGPVFWKILKEARYELPYNYSPDCTFDEVTREYIFALGSYPLQRFDGYHFRKLRALSDPEDLVVEQWVGFVTEKTAGAAEDPSFIKNAFLRSEPPAGKFVHFFANRLFVAGLSGDPARVVFSAPGAYNDLWPKGYETMVRDPNGSPIVGINSLNDELVVFTPTSIYAATAPDELGYITVQPRSFGIGFINQDVVQRVVFKGSAILVGANADGIYAYTGADPQIILDRWDRIIEDGVNKSTMYRSCATVSYYDNVYYLAVPSFNANYPDKLVRYCWEDKTMYVWNAPFGGISSMTAVRDESGSETIVFGHVDGTVSELSPNLSDDGETITGKCKTAIFSTGGVTMAVKGYLVTMGDTGGSTNNTITLRQYLDEDEGSATTIYSGQFDGGTAEIDSFTLDTDKVGSEKKKLKKANAKSGTRAETVQLEVEGTGRWKLRGIELLQSPKGQRSK